MLENYVQYFSPSIGIVPMSGSSCNKSGSTELKEDSHGKRR